MINKSLLTLGLVINKLSEGAQLNGAVDVMMVHTCQKKGSSWSCMSV